MGILPGTNIALEIVALCHPLPMKKIGDLYEFVYVNLYKKTNVTGVGILPGTNIALEIVALCHPLPRPLRQW